MLRLKRTLCFAAALLSLGAFAMAEGPVSGDAPGQDLEAAFVRAHAGAPLRLAALGGSITQAGEGWIGAWLKDAFPKSPVTVRSAGMSAMGSELGVFRLERDIISSQPDLVLVEFAVNDGGLSDESAIRYLESIVVRLKSLEHPPAIVFLEAAARNKSNRARHSKVAAHYGLVDVDLQVALDAHLAAKGIPWDSLMSDDVHPNKEGHAFYSEVIAKALAPYVEAAKVKANPTLEFKGKLPSPLSSKPLLLDGRMEIMPLVPGWSFENGTGAWWDRFLLGVLTAKTPGASLSIPFRGTFCGVFFAMDKSYGRFFASVDGEFPVLAATNTRGGYSYKLAGSDLAPCEHLLTMVIPKNDAEAPVKLGYLLIAGETGSSRERAPFGDFDASALSTLSFASIPASKWEWAGPFGGSERVTSGVTADLQAVFPPEAEFLSGRSSGAVVWKPLEGELPLVDFGKLTGDIDKGVNYARAKIWSEKARKARLGFVFDYFAKIWVNGVLLKTFPEGHGGPTEPVYLPVELKQGWNDVFVKIHSGSKGNNFLLLVQEP